MDFQLKKLFPFTKKIEYGLHLFIRLLLGFLKINKMGIGLICLFTITQLFLKWLKQNATNRYNQVKVFFETIYFLSK